MLGILVEEGNQRQQTYYRQGCNAFEAKTPVSWPLAVWTGADIWEYIRTNDVAYSPIYDMGYERTGCVFCGFGAHLEPSPNRFQRLAATHPKLWNAAIAMGFREAMSLVGVDVDPQGPLFVKER